MNRGLGYWTKGNEIWQAREGVNAPQQRHVKLKQFYEFHT